VLTSDAPSGRDELDRSAALAFLRAHLKFPEELGPDERFVDGASLSLAPLDEIDRELRRSARSTLATSRSSIMSGSSQRMRLSLQTERTR
jgi:DEAD/DEAH box helicase domain-containing protein